MAGLVLRRSGKCGMRIAVTLGYDKVPQIVTLSGQIGPHDVVAVVPSARVCAIRRTGMNGYAIYVVGRASGSAEGSGAAGRGTE
jgi:hypothetical protein